MNKLCFEKVLAAVREGQQAMVFVHSRKDTVKVGEALVEMIKESDLPLFQGQPSNAYNYTKEQFKKSR